MDERRSEMRAAPKPTAMPKGRSEYWTPIIVPREMAAASSITVHYDPERSVRRQGDAKEDVAHEHAVVDFRACPSSMVCATA